MIIPTIKVVSSACNLNCIYCYYGNKKAPCSSSRMKKETLLNLLKNFLLSTDQRKINFIWHGGEPFLAGIDFYKEIVRLQKEFRNERKTVNNYIQTNGTLITSKWAVFLRKNYFRVGISIDGPKEIHDFNRPYKSGNGSFKRVITGLKNLQSVGIYPSALAVITKTSVGKPKEIFNFFIENKIFNFHPKPCYELDEIGNLTDFSITPEQYSNFLIQIFELWMATNNPKITVRNLAEIIKGLMGAKPNLCELNGECSKFLTFESDGSVGACDSFPLRQYPMGNINYVNIQELLSSSGYKQFKKDLSENRRKCFKCNWYKICHEGCLRYSFSLEKFTWYLNDFCESRKRLFSYLDKRIKEIMGGT